MMFRVEISGFRVNRVGVVLMCNCCNVLYVLFHTLFQVTNDCRLFSITFCLIFRNTLEISASEDRCFEESTFMTQGQGQGRT